MKTTKHLLTLALAAAFLAAGSAGASIPSTTGRAVSLVI